MDTRQTYLYVSIHELRTHARGGVLLHFLLILEPLRCWRLGSNGTCHLLYVWMKHCSCSSQCQGTAQSLVSSQTSQQAPINPIPILPLMLTWIISWFPTRSHPLGACLHFNHFAHTYCTIELDKQQSSKTTTQQWWLPVTESRLLFI